VETAILDHYVPCLAYRLTEKERLNVDPVELRSLGLEPSIIRDISPTGAIDAGSEEYDFLFSDNVLEHVADLGAFVRETYRILKPGG
jgi:2-polyprenyl-3-methyl-5-hydroxy-6-metoxy-1,4-benzoquinol methylase